jgi:hypothetical protein
MYESKSEVLPSLDNLHQMVTVPNTAYYTISSLKNSFIMDHIIFKVPLIPLSVL